MPISASLNRKSHHLFLWVLAGLEINLICDGSSYCDILFSDTILA